MKWKQLKYRIFKNPPRHYLSLFPENQIPRLGHISKKYKNNYQEGNWMAKLSSHEKHPKDKA